jgi:hypothetical protein
MLLVKGSPKKITLSFSLFLNPSCEWTIHQILATCVKKICIKIKNISFVNGVASIINAILHQLATPLKYVCKMH